MRIAVLVYLTVLSYPFITLLVPEPISFRWWWRTGGLPMPPEIMERSLQNKRKLLIVKFLLLILTSFLFLRCLPISPASLGFRLKQPTGTLFMGVAAGLLLIRWVFAMRSLNVKVTPRPGEDVGFFVGESTTRILLIMILGALAEELWRALALTTFDKAGISTVYAIFFTSISFGVGHVSSYNSLGHVLGRIMAPTIAGVFLAALFLWSQTLFSPLIVHVLLNSVISLMSRKHAFAIQTSKGENP
jgi:membrane protease YdiL (CAAX protease family)